MNRLLAILGNFPSTGARVVVTLFMYVATGIVTLATDNFPGGELWAGVLCIFGGLDITGFIGKRATFKTPKEMEGCDE